ncbi:hypothetical protein AB1Y20_006219 [Prymnesium parvum]|uniref:Uncharacterized protein n=1 Tax=Prymnesium parvum TaxID=97485 RepID=A0AB34J225_PRYPA
MSLGTVTRHPHQPPPPAHRNLGLNHVGAPLAHAAFEPLPQRLVSISPPLAWQGGVPSQTLLYVLPGDIRPSRDHPTPLVLQAAAGHRSMSFGEIRKARSFVSRRWHTSTPSLRAFPPRLPSDRLTERCLQARGCDGSSAQAHGTLQLAASKARDWALQSRPPRGLVLHRDESEC